MHEFSKIIVTPSVAFLDVVVGYTGIYQEADINRAAVILQVLSLFQNQNTNNYNALNQVIALFSTFVAMYCLIILYWSTREPLSYVRTGLKFLTIKIVVILLRIEDMALPILVDDYDKTFTKDVSYTQHLLI